MNTFGTVIANPPYQDQKGSGGSNDAPIYQHFSRVANVVASRFADLIIKGAWMSAGRENLLGEFRQEMKRDASLRMMTAYLNLRPSVCSQTYLYAKFDTKVKAENFVSYLKTRFFRIVVSAYKITQHAQDRVYSYVPMQDFNESWTDEKLYKKYGITKEEQSFIESMIKPMA